MKNRVGFWARPWHDYLRLLQVVAKGFSVFHLFLLLSGVAIGWWLYVPIHELFHAWGCLLTGGEVSRLEISPEYGAAFLQRYFPYVAIGSDYAGQLVEFDTHGSDWIYAATVLAPFILTVYPGIPLFYYLLSRPWANANQFFSLGLIAPIVVAPFVALLGDFYEIGSIIASNVGTIIYPGVDTSIWRGDDFLLVLETVGPTATPHDWAGMIGGLVIGIVLAWLVYTLGVFLRHRPKGHSIGRY